ncbi:alpha/beta hydrolase [Pseudonocardia yunnanensis]|uniref:Alpha/beta fold hydrolase n=1 Tax=Pseudonocardia yunnanensis TaxID=58107 RepID=A0ABW4EZP2_9PSEU
MSIRRSVPAADGAVLNVELDGPADAPVSIVLAHGWTLDVRLWGPVARLLVQERGPVRVVRYDHRGHGWSAAVDPASMTIEQLADDLAAVIAAVAPDGPLVLAGHSMGGMTLMALAERHPSIVERAAGIALVSTASGGLAGRVPGIPAPARTLWRPLEERLYASRPWCTRPRLGYRRLLAPALRRLLLGPDASPEARRITSEMIAACRPLTMSGFRPTLEAHERDAALEAFAPIPTAVLVGSRDRLTPVAATRRIASALPSAGLTIFPEAGHMLPVERAAGVAGRIRALAAGAVPATR